MKKRIATVVAVGVTLAGGAIQAAHNNPWATPEDTLLSKYHDANQARSVATPGEDEMRGVMTRNAFGKLGGSDDDARQGADSGVAGSGSGTDGGGSGPGGKGGRR